MRGLESESFTSSSGNTDVTWAALASFRSAISMPSFRINWQGCDFHQDPWCGEGRLNSNRACRYHAETAQRLLGSMTAGLVAWHPEVHTTPIQTAGHGPMKSSENPVGFGEGLKPTPNFKAIEAVPPGDIHMCNVEIQIRSQPCSIGQPTLEVAKISDSTPNPRSESNGS